MKGSIKLFLLIICLLASLGVMAVVVYLFLNTPASYNGEPVIYMVNHGANFQEITADLFAMKVISSKRAFRWLGKLYSAPSKIRAGEYKITPTMSPVDILKTLMSGKSIRYEVAIPEGYNLNQIAEIFDSKGLVDKSKFLAATYDPVLISKFGIIAKSMEGYLFPSKYYFSRTDSLEKILYTMFAAFKKNITDEYLNRAKELGYSMHQIITLASIIEKETGETSERPLISSVFHNRLKQGIRLQSDPTTIYGIENFNGNLTKKDLQTATPYNTYAIKGLPIGPIASPGAEAIRAALYPAKTNYLFFVSRNDGTHEFTATYRDHSNAVTRFQKRRENRVGKSWRDRYAK